MSRSIRVLLIPMLASVAGCQNETGGGPAISPATEVQRSERTEKSTSPRAESHKEYTERLLAVIQKQATTLRTIKDVKTAENALPELQKLMAELSWVFLYVSREDESKLH